MPLGMRRPAGCGWPWRATGRTWCTITDDGHGFDLAEARGRGGLGLISLNKRVRLVRGQLTIETQVQGGTPEVASARHGHPVSATTRTRNVGRASR